MTDIPEFVHIRTDEHGVEFIRSELLASLNDRRPWVRPVFTERRLGFLRMLADGKRHKEIAAAAGITESMVRDTLLRMRRKVRVRTLSGLVAFAFRNGLVT